MGIAVRPEEYIPASPSYVKDGEDDIDDQDTDGDEDVEAPFLTPKENPTPKTPWDEQTAPTPLKGNTASAEDSQVSSSDESIPELIDPREEEDVPPKRANHPTTLGLHNKIAVTAEKPLVFPSPLPKDDTETLLVAAPGVHTEKVPKEQIAYIDDNADPSPPQPTRKTGKLPVHATTSVYDPHCAETRLPPRVDQQPSKVLEKRRHPPGAAGKKTLQERRKGKPLKLNICTVAKMRTGPAEVHRTQELARQACAVVPLQKLNIQEDTDVKVPKTTPEAKTPTPPLK